MNERTFVIIFLTVTLLSAGVIMFGKFQNQLNSSSTPQPTTDPALAFNTSPAVNNLTTPSPSAVPSVTIKQFKSFPLLSPADLQNKKAIIDTAKGKIEFDISPEATKAASSFIFLAENNFFDGLTFHRVEPGFVIQGGDPLGNGTGGPGYTFADEPFNGSYTKGTVAMANAGPNTNGSQFFIMLDDHPELPKQYTIFGHVSSGQDVVDKIAVGDVMRSVVIASQ